MSVTDTQNVVLTLRMASSTATWISERGMCNSRADVSNLVVSSVLLLRPAVHAEGPRQSLSGHAFLPYCECGHMLPSLAFSSIPRPTLL
jgi:hypothetical protein